MSIAVFVDEDKPLAAEMRRLASVHSGRAGELRRRADELEAAISASSSGTTTALRRLTGITAAAVRIVMQATDGKEAA